MVLLLDDGVVVVVVVEVIGDVDNFGLLVVPDVGTDRGSVA